jgi:hypothetical protein
MHEAGNQSAAKRLDDLHKHDRNGLGRAALPRTQLWWRS